MFSNASATIAPLSPAAAFALRLGLTLGRALPMGSCRLGRRRTFRAGRKLGKDIGKLGGDGSGGRFARRAGAHDADSLRVALSKLQESPVHT